MAQTIVTRAGIEGVDFEELAAEPLGQEKFVVTSVPFTDREVALGDIVECVMVGGKLTIDRVLARGGNSTLRILPEGVDVISPLLSVGCHVEQGPAGLVAVNIAPDQPYAGIVEWLEGLAEAGLVQFTPGFTSPEHY